MTHKEFNFWGFFLCDLQLSLFAAGVALFSVSIVAKIQKNRKCFQVFLVTGTLTMLASILLGLWGATWIRVD